MRNLLAFVVSLAGYSTTPAEELDGIYEAEVVEPKKPPQAPPPQKAPTTPGMVSTEDAEKIRDLMIAIGYEKKNILQILSIRVGHELKRMGEITQEQAVGIIGDLEGERAKKEGSGE
jgi:hypothetical protein